MGLLHYILCYIMRGSFETFVEWRQCAAFMQSEVVTVCQVLMVEVT
jgi:hypothetical protein